ncbi:hypothetical protein [Kineococcus sp. R86509]|uniref:hypothetical protein n=1 Tax=Kineococcus sp. R86509 TaxID=3093851 RepID=UPI0036D3ECA4
MASATDAAKPETFAVNSWNLLDPSVTLRTTSGATCTATTTGEVSRAAVELNELVATSTLWASVERETADAAGGGRCPRSR